MSLAIFDLDGTLIEGLSQLKLIRYLRKQKAVGLAIFLKILAWFLAYKLQLVRSPHKIMVYAYKRMAEGANVEAMENLMSDFYENVLQSSLNFAAIARLSWHRQRGDEVILLTNVPEPLARVVARKLGIRTVLATRLVEDEGIYSGNIDGEIVYGVNKVTVLQRHYGENELKDSYAYADHISDKALMLLVDHPFRVSAKSGEIREMRW